MPRSLRATFAVADRLGLAGIAFKVVQRKRWIQVQLPAAGANRRQCSVTAVIEERVGVLVARNDLLPFEAGIPRASGGTVRSARAFRLGLGTTSVSTNNSGADVAPVDDIGPSELQCRRATRAWDTSPLHGRQRATHARVESRSPVPMQCRELECPLHTSRVYDHAQVQSRCVRGRVRYPRRKRQRFACRLHPRCWATR